MLNCIKYYCFRSDGESDKWYERNKCLRCMTGISLSSGIIVGGLLLLMIIWYPLGILFQLILGEGINYNVLFTTVAGAVAFMFIFICLAGIALGLVTLVLLFAGICMCLLSCCDVYKESEVYEEKQRLLKTEKSTNKTSEDITPGNNHNSPDDQTPEDHISV